MRSSVALPVILFERFPQDVVELMAYFQAAEPGQAIQAVPGAGLDVPIWILGSSTYGAQLAAILGLPFAFASHFAPAMLTDQPQLAVVPLAARSTFRVAAVTAVTSICSLPI